MSFKDYLKEAIKVVSVEDQLEEEIAKLQSEHHATVKRIDMKVKQKLDVKRDKEHRDQLVKKIKTLQSKLHNLE